MKQKTWIVFFIWGFLLQSCGFSSNPNPLKTTSKGTKPTCKEARAAWETFYKEPKTTYCQVDEDCINVGAVLSSCSENYNPAPFFNGRPIAKIVLEKANKLIEKIMSCKKWEVPLEYSIDEYPGRVYCWKNTCNIHITSCISRPTDPNP